VHYDESLSLNNKYCWNIFQFFTYLSLANMVLSYVGPSFGVGTAIQLPNVSPLIFFGGYSGPAGQIRIDSTKT
jgi:hypothetical protein